VGIAPHSVRAVPLAYLKEIVSYGNEKQLPIHMHVAEQTAEVSACIHEHGRSPVALLSSEGLFSERFTAVHAIHVTAKAITSIAEAGALVCACPTTERNLGDGVVPAEILFDKGVRVALGTDSHTLIDLLEDARELEAISSAEPSVPCWQRQTTIQCLVWQSSCLLRDQQRRRVSAYRVEVWRGSGCRFLHR
jgi:formimidoylglutamate deiminase